MVNVPPPVQLGSPWPPERVHVPTTTPLVSVPVVVVFPFEVPVKLPVMDSVLPAGVTEFTLRSSVPVTAFAELVVKVAVPFSFVESTAVPKHAP